MPHWPIPPWHNIKYDLTRIKSLLHFLDNPHYKIPPVIHVAGTNGKGSTTAFLRAIFENAGYKVHLYTSPHLVEFNERIIVASHKINDHQLFQVCEKVRIAALNLSDTLSFFEGTTAAAFVAFAETPADIVILETGMGGRLDATNVIDHPLATIITSISYDHMEYLGPSLPLIAREKAGIIKADTLCIISNQVDEVFEILFEICEMRNTPVKAFQHDFGIEILADGFKFVSPDFNYEFSRPILQGRHQYLNAANAIACVKSITGFNITNENIKQGLLTAKWPGRLQKIEQGIFYEMLKNKFEIWADGAHNIAGSMMLANWIKDNNKKPVFLIFGMTKNRDVYAFLRNFENIVDRIFGVLIEAEPSSYPAQKLQELASPLDIPFLPVDSLEDAFKQIHQIDNAGGTVIVTGSLFLVGDLLRISKIII